MFILKKVTVYMVNLQKYVVLVTSTKQVPSQPLVEVIIDICSKSK